MRQIRIFWSDAHFATLSVRQIRIFRSDAHFVTLSVRQIRIFRPDAHFVTLSVRQLRFFWSDAHFFRPDAQMLFHCVTQHTFSTSGVTLNRLKWDSAHHFIHGSPTNLPAMGLNNQLQHRESHSSIKQTATYYYKPSPTTGVYLFSSLPGARLQTLDRNDEPRSHHQPQP